MALCNPLCPCSSDCISSLYFIILHILEQNKDLIWFDLTISYACSASGHQSSPCGLTSANSSTEMGLVMHLLSRFLSTQPPCHHSPLVHKTTTCDNVHTILPSHLVLALSLTITLSNACYISTYSRILLCILTHYLYSVYISRMFTCWVLSAIY